MAGKLVAGFFFLVSIGYLLVAQNLSFGTFGAPKAGFMPTLVGIAAVVLSLAAMLVEFFPGQRTSPGLTNWRKLLFIIVGLFLYVFLLGMAGYFAASFLIMFYLLKVTDTGGWVTPLVIAGGVSVSCYLIFVIYLGVTFPQ